MNKHNDTDINASNQHEKADFADFELTEPLPSVPQPTDESETQTLPAMREETERTAVLEVVQSVDAGDVSGDVPSDVPSDVSDVSDVSGGDTLADMNNDDVVDAHSGASSDASNDAATSGDDSASAAASVGDDASDNDASDDVPIDVPSDANVVDAHVVDAHGASPDADPSGASHDAPSPQAVPLYGTQQSQASGAQPYVQVPQMLIDQPVVRASGPSKVTIVFGVFLLIVGSIAAVTAVYGMELPLALLFWLDSDPRVVFVVGCAAIGGLLIAIAIIWSIVKVARNGRSRTSKEDSVEHTARS